MKKVPGSSSVLLLITTLLFLSSCFQDRRKEFEEETGANRWIYEVMQEKYFWEEDIPARSRLNLFAPQPDFFSSLLSSKDKFSYMEEVKSSPRSAHSRSSYGFEYATYNSPRAARVLYILPNSPAAESGLRRGDWIIAVNGEEITSENATTIIEEKSGELKLTVTTYESIQEEEEENKEIWEITVPAARLVEDNPFLVRNIYTAENKKIGYLVYNHFSYGTEDTTGDLTYWNEMIRTFGSFKEAGINDLILDLRYNPGGYLVCAQLMASLIVPATHLNEVFMILRYNANYEPELNADGEDENTILRFMKQAEVPNNLNLPDLYVITSSGTASASEAVIYGLRPYMNVTVIGTGTVGKNVGSQAFTNTEYPNWILHPITFQLYNSKEESDYSSGIPANYTLAESAAPWYDLGDTREALLNYAVSIIVNDDSGEEEEEDDEGDENEINGSARSRATKYQKELIPVYQSFKKKEFLELK